MTSQPRPSAYFSHSVDNRSTWRPDWVLAAPFSAHFSYLVDHTRLDWRVVARYCGIPTRLGARLLGARVPKRICHYLADRLISVNPSDLTRLAYQPAAGVREAKQLGELREAGFGAAHIAEVCGLKPYQVAAAIEVELQGISRLFALHLDTAWAQLMHSDDAPEPDHPVQWRKFESSALALAG